MSKTNWVKMLNDSAVQSPSHTFLIDVFLTYHLRPLHHRPPLHHRHLSHPCLVLNNIWPNRQTDRERENQNHIKLFQTVAATNFFWTASHAIGAHSSSRSHTPNHNRITDGDECIGTTLQQNSLAPEAAHRPSIPTAIDTNLLAQTRATPICSVAQTSKQPTDTCAIAKSPNCNECGLSIT